MDRELLEPIYIHKEEEPNINDLNTNSLNIYNSIENIQSQLSSIANDVKSLLNNKKLQINNIKEMLIYEKERLQDINILCNKYSDFYTTMNLNEDSFTGSMLFENNYISSNVTNRQNVDFNINAINGNGFEGNKYVYVNSEFVENTLDTSNRKYINDNDITTVYEYSRITVDNVASNESLPIDFNNDSIEAVCSLELHFDDYINELFLISDRDDTIIDSIYISEDGLIWNKYKEFNLSLNNKEDRFYNQKYIYTSGLIAIKSTKYVKITLKSNGYSNDTLAYSKLIYSDEENYKKTSIVNNAKRHVIRINDIKAYKSIFSNSMLLSNELIKDHIDYIALFANEYIQEGYDISKNIEYYLIINGIEYKINPINSNRDGVKIVRHSIQSYKSEYVTYINESIKSAKLKIVSKLSNKEVSPYISNVKILIGGINHGK